MRSFRKGWRAVADRFSQRACQPPVDISAHADEDVGTPAHWEGHHLA
jgi:hypothetical protein